MKQVIPLIQVFLPLLSALPAAAQPPSAPPRTEVGTDRTIIFRVRAPSAQAVRLDAGDVPNLPPGGAMKKREDGVWELNVGPVPPGAYRYTFHVDGVRTLDPVNLAASESNLSSWSVVLVPGSDLFDLKDVPHGAVAQVTYHSRTLNRPRRMHVYTPPGYEGSTERYPVLYLLHGAFDTDAAWTTVGRAAVIMDNLIASGKAVPMVVVMPNGHTGPFDINVPNALNRQVQEFTEEFLADIQPFVEGRYRLRGDRANRAIAGLSMGGAQTLEIALRRVPEFAYVGVFSSGAFSLRPGAPASLDPTFTERHRAGLAEAAGKRRPKLLWFATGKDDFLVGVSRATVEAVRGKGVEVEYAETEGGHTWLKWRDYLAEFAPRLFRR